MCLFGLIGDCYLGMILENQFSRGGRTLLLIVCELEVGHHHLARELEGTGPS